MSRPLHHHLKHAFIPHEGNQHRPHALRPRWLRVYGLAVITVKLLVAVLVAFAPGVSYVSGVTPQNILKLTNEARSGSGLSALSANGLLAQAAQAKANDMIAHGYFAHTSPANVTPWDWFKRAGYSYKYAGENLAKDFATTEDLVAAWLNSPSHRKNILNSNFREIGIAVATGELNGVSTLVVAQLFGTPYQVELAVSEPAPAPAPARPANTVVVTPPPEPEPSAPTKPIIIQPKDDSLINDSTPPIVGTTSPGASVAVREKERILATATTNDQGAFETILTEGLSEGAHTIDALATEARRSLTSPPSDPVTFVIDTIAPGIDQKATVVLPAWEPRGAYTVFAEVDDANADVVAMLNGRATPLTLTADGFYGLIAEREAASPTAVIGVQAVDRAKNQTAAAIMRTDFFQSEVLQPARTLSPELVLNLILYSKNILLALLIFLTIALALHVFIRFRVQHHPTTVSTLVLMYAIVVLLII